MNAVMNFCTCLSDDAETRRNAEIEEQLKRDKKMAEVEVKMLLLGAGESGKSTILKQMKMIHSGGYTKEEKAPFKQIIFTNIVVGMKAVVEALDLLEIELEHPENQQHADLIMEVDSLVESDTFPDDLAVAIKALLQDAGVQEAIERSAEFQLNDSAAYFFGHIDRISDPSFFPTDQDVLRSRVKTTGIIETTFDVGTLTYRMFDVGGQRSERKKWIHCFENVTAIIFMVAISEYDQALIEDENMNRMQEALTLFDSICNSRWFAKTSIILFLNKIDLFKVKLPKVPIEDFFEDYEGGNDYEAATEYFKERFTSLNQSETKQVYPHLTCGTDTTQIKFVMQAVNDIIIKEALRGADLL